MAILSIYITDAEFQVVLKTLDVEKTPTEQQELLDRAVGEMEGELVERYIIPLQAINGDFTAAPQYSRMMVLNAVKAKIRQIIGADNARNLVIDSTQKFIDTHQAEFTRLIKILKDSKKRFGFLQHDYTEDAIDPVQTIGIARADNEPHIRLDPDQWPS